MTRGAVALLLRRLLLIVPQAFAVSVVVFFVTRVIPGDPTAMIAGVQATPEVLASIRRQLGLDLSLPQQFLAFLGDLARGSLGTSWYTGNPVEQDLLARLPATLELITAAMLVALLVGLPLGASVALRPGGVFDRVSRLLSRGAGAIPSFWWALLAVYVFYTVLRWAPAPVGRLPIGMSMPGPSGFLLVDAVVAGDFGLLWEGLRHLALPAGSFGLLLSMVVVRMTRQMFNQVLHAPHIRFALASGLGRASVLRYAVRSIVPSLVTLVGVLFTYTLTGAVLVESVFSWPGVGLYAISVALRSDYLAIGGAVLVVTAISLTVYALIDVVRLLADPRIRA